jgi:hypothetical protein
MSKISTVFDTISTDLATLFPTKTDIPYPESLSDNPETLLRNGYGVTFEGSTLNGDEFCGYAIDYNFKIILTKEFVDFDSNYSNDDTTKKELLEDVYLVQKDFYNVDKIGLGDNVERISLGSVSPIQSLDNKRKIRYVELNLTFNIKEGF